MMVKTENDFLIRLLIFITIERKSRKLSMKGMRQNNCFSFMEVLREELGTYNTFKMSFPF